MGTNMSKRWITFFSMSGSEICNLSLRLKRSPDLVITNRSNLEGVDTRLFDLIDVSRQLIMLPNKPTTEEYGTAIEHVSADDVLVTLHGYLRILPADVCEKYTILNGHPGLITTYPELKGKDPQRRCINHSIIGTVIHQVTAGVDEGPIINSNSCDNVFYNEAIITKRLKHMSEHLWVDTLRNQYNLQA